MPVFYHNKKDRAELARKVERIATKATGIQWELIAEFAELRDHDLRDRKENVESTRGKVKHISIEVCLRGISLYVQFDCAELGPDHTSKPNGKWNHYIWPMAGDNQESFEAWGLVELHDRLLEIGVIPDSPPRHDHPDKMTEQFRVWRNEREARA